MRKKLLIFVLSCFVLSLGLTVGCKKNKGKYLIEGTLTDQTFGQPLANQSVTVGTQTAGSTSFTTHSTITTDANGKYAVEIERGEINNIKFTSTKTNYFTIEFVVPISILTLDQTYILNKSTTAKAWSRLIFVHQTGDPNAVLEYTKNDGKQDCIECCPKTTQTLTGFVNDTVYCINDGNTNYSYNYVVIGAGGFNTKTCYTPAFDTGQVILNY